MERGEGAYSGEGGGSLCRHVDYADNRHYNTYEASSILVSLTRDGHLITVLEANLQSYLKYTFRQRKQTDNFSIKSIEAWRCAIEDVCE